MMRKILSAVVILAVMSLAYFYTFEYNSIGEIHESIEAKSDSIDAESFKLAPTILYGMVVDSFQIEENAVKRNQSISDILLAYNVSHQTIFQLANLSKNVFDVRKLAANKKYTVIYQEEDSLPSAKALVYEPNPEEYVVFDLKDSMKVYVEKDLSQLRKSQLVVLFDLHFMKKS